MDCGNGRIATSLRNTVIYSGRNDNDHRDGVMIMMLKAAKKSMMEWTTISERLMLTRFNPGKISVIQCNTPTNDAEEETIEHLINTCKKH